MEYKGHEKRLLIKYFKRKVMVGVNDIANLVINNFMFRKPGSI